MKRTDFKYRLEHLMGRLRAQQNMTVVDAEVSEPLSKEELSTVHARLGFNLDPGFVAYFKSTNGARISWVVGSNLEREEAS